MCAGPAIGQRRAQSPTPQRLVTVLPARHHCKARIAEEHDSMARETHDRGPEFDGVKIGRPATGALIDAGYRRLADLPEQLDRLLQLHGVGPSAVSRLEDARDGH